MTTLPSDYLTAEQTPQDLDCLGHALFANRSGFERQSDGLVLGEGVSGADADLEPPSAEMVEGGQLLRNNDGMTKIVVENERADPNPTGCGSDSGERYQDPGHGAEVIADLDDVEAVMFGRLRRSDDLGDIFSRGLEGETEWPHGWTIPASAIH